MDDAQFLEELKKDFFDEAKTLIDMLESNILILEKDFSNQEAINEIFRAAHTLKGGSATLDLDRIANFTHEMESLLDEIRSGNIKLTSEMIDVLLKAIDIVKTLIDASLKGVEAKANIETDVIKEMKKIYQPEMSQETKQEAIKIAKEMVETRHHTDYKLNEYDRYLLRNAPEEGYEVYDVYVILNKNNPMKTVSGIQIHSILKEFSQIVKSVPDLDDLFQDKFYKEVNFLILSKKSKDYIQEKITISDVTEIVEVHDFEEAESLEIMDDRVKSTDIRLELSEEQEKLIEDAGRKGLTVFKITVDFDETNPMRSVSGLLLYTMLASYGDVLFSTPSFEEFKEDKFYESAVFVLSTTNTQEYLKSHVYISDVTKDIEFDEIEGGKSASSEEKSLRPVEEEETVTDVEDVNKKIAETNKAKDVKKEEAKESSKEKESKTQDSIKKNKPQTQILRVDSGRIDELVNLVSQLVIEKGSFTKISDISSEISEFFSSSYSNFKKDLNAMVDEISANTELKKDENNSFTISNEINVDTDSEEEEEEITVKKLYKNKVEKLIRYFDKIIPKVKEIQDKIKDVNSQFNMITNDIHESVMKVRMVPISQLFQRFPRLVRDLSKSLNKEVELITEGEDTELDKNTIENLVHPLIHIIRNSMDHGLENPEDRVKKGKPEKGRIHIKASQEGNLVVITVSDDGRGLNLDKIRNKAIEKGLIEPNVELSEMETANLIFQPGFSTKDEATDLSGRGVGMDVVKKAIESERGHVDITTTPDVGTVFTLKLPLTMAIIQALQVRVGDNIYCVPINFIIETQRLRDGMIERLEGNEVVRLREEIVSVVRLDELFNLKQKEESKMKYLIYVGTGNKKIGLVVDQLITEESVVIKPLNNKYVDSLGISGASILGDGSVALILEIPGIMELMMKTRQRKNIGLRV